MSDTTLKSNLIPLRHSDISPRIILEELLAASDDIQDIYVVAVSKARREYSLHVTGDFAGCCGAAAVITDFALNVSKETYVAE